MAATSPTLPPLADVLGVVRRWRRPILLTTAATAIVSAILAVRMPNIYPATAAFYATNLETSDPDQLGSGERKVVLLPQPFDLDRAVNIGRSQPVADYIIKKYHLARHYKNDTTTTPEALQVTREEFQERLSITVSDRDAVELTFMDTDRDLAATIANDLVAQIDSASQQLMQPNRQNVVALFEAKYRILNQAFKITRDSLMQLRALSGVYGLAYEDRYLTKELTARETELAIARVQNSKAVAGLEAAVDQLRHKRPGGNTLTLEGYSQYHEQVSRLYAELGGIQNSLVQARTAYESAKALLSSRVSNIYVLQPAYPVARKVKPVRWLIVVSSTVAAFVLATLAALLLERLREPDADGDFATAPPLSPEPLRSRA